MTGRHSGRLHAARLLLKVCVCCMCTHLPGKKELGSLRVQARACVSGHYCLFLCVSISLALDCSAHLARERRPWPVTANESQLSSNQSTLTVWESNTERKEKKKGRESQSERPCLSLHILSVSLDSSVAAQSDQTSYRFGVFGLNRLQQPQLHRKRRCTVK